MAGGGINALRGESNVQGSTDMGLLFHILPGYLKTPTRRHGDARRLPREDDAQDRTSHKTANWWQNTPKYMVSLLKAWWGDHATEENEFAYTYLPKLTSANYSHIALFEAMDEDGIKGLFCFGQNPAVGGPNCAQGARRAGEARLAGRVDLCETDTIGLLEAARRRSGDDPDRGLPAARRRVGREGRERRRTRAAGCSGATRRSKPPGVAKPTLGSSTLFVGAAAKRYKQGGAFPEPIVHLTLGLRRGRRAGHASRRQGGTTATRVSDVTSRRQDLQARPAGRRCFAVLTADGSTACGCWIYCGSYTDDGNMMARRELKRRRERLGLYPPWAWCWPVNRRIIYNRASVDAQRRTRGIAKRWVVRWDPALKDGKEDGKGTCPTGPGRLRTSSPSSCSRDGVALALRRGLADGPFAEHYEPLESPVQNLLSSQGVNPAVKIWEPDRTSARRPVPDRRDDLPRESSTGRRGR